MDFFIYIGRTIKFSVFLFVIIFLYYFEMMSADSNSSSSKIIVVVRKRPISKKELSKGESDIVEIREVN
jgi:hypothetical protein